MLYTLKIVKVNAFCLKNVFLGRAKVYKIANYSSCICKPESFFTFFLKFLYFCKFIIIIINIVFFFRYRIKYLIFHCVFKISNSASVDWLLYKVSTAAYMQINASFSLCHPEILKETNFQNAMMGAMKIEWNWKSQMQRWPGITTWLSNI